MNKKVLIAIVLLFTIAISGCINSSMDNINIIMPKISEDIVNANDNYNDAVNFVNSHNYDAADSKVKKSTASYNEAQNELLSIDSIHQLNDTIYDQYIDLISQEISLKQNATLNLQLAIQYFKSGNNETANEFVEKANSQMTQGVSVQKQRQDLVLNYPDKFNKNS